MARRKSPTRVLGYVRVSTEDRAEDPSLTVQQRRLERWAMQRGWDFAEVIVEFDVSGSIPFRNRPDGGRLWEQLQRGDVVVAAKLDRMFRSALDYLDVVEAFKARGISLYSLDLNGGAEDVSGNGIARLFLTIVSAFAEFERDLIAERNRAAKRRQMARGDYLGGPAPFGWRYDADRKLVEIPKQQKALKRIRSLRAKGMSLRKIAAALAAEGHKLSHTSVASILAAQSASMR
jgi:putative DNA-invertase from lambdoid prophage Rac